MVGKKNCVPLPFHAEYVMVPLKVRKTFSKDQGALGYVVLDKVVECISGGEGEVRCSLKLKGGALFPCMEKIETVRNRLRDAQMIKEEYCRFYSPCNIKGAADDPQGVIYSPRGLVVYHLYCCLKDYSMIKMGGEQKE
ncbi:MAG: hypothetical protein GX088_07385 [Clostridia bacterium]|nr:hypothetical protein [Clostridia bacterium]